ncbi:hypothetical protein PQX77_007094, partial [Marasmius sp. AFHP31]
MELTNRAEDGFVDECRWSEHDLDRRSQWYRSEQDSNGDSAPPKSQSTSSSVPYRDHPYTVSPELAPVSRASSDMQAGHIENISFSSVAPVNVQVHDVTVEVTIENAKKSKGIDVEAGARKVKKILDGISADFP